MLFIRIRHFFTQINKQQIANSTYEQLVDRIARNYNMKQYKNQSGLCLLQIHHQFNIFKPGDWVLDVGAGVNYAWTDLALKLTANDENTNMVISNDIVDLRKNRENNIFVRGNITQQPVKTNIAMHLQNHDLDTILYDVSPQFTGSVNDDGRAIMEMVANSFQLVENFLKKGGNLVLKVLESQAQPLLEESLEIYFAQKYKYVPSIVRKSSPVCFYVMKGFLISQSYEALNKFFRQYKGTPEKKIKVVEKYQGKYTWDPIKTIRKQIMNNIIKMQSQGRPDKEIIKAFANDPYTKVQKILKLLKQADEAKRNRNSILYEKIMNQLTDGQLYKDSVDMPQNQDQFYQKMLTVMQQTVKQNKQKKKQKKQKVSRALLKQNQTYMKVQDKVNQPKPIQKDYRPGDLQGRYSQSLNKQQLDLELNKIQSIHPQLKRMMQQFQQAQKPNSQMTIEDIIKQNKHKYEELSEEKLRNIQEQVEESLKKEMQYDPKQDSLAERDMWVDDYKVRNQAKEDRFVNQRRLRRKKPLY